jgi:hypothetical protein
VNKEVMPTRVDLFNFCLQNCSMRCRKKYLYKTVDGFEDNKLHRKSYTKYSLFFNQRTTTPQFTPKIELTTLYYSGHGILANIYLIFLKKNDVNQSLASLINDNY